jgi:hypothetical protein
MRIQDFLFNKFERLQVNSKVINTIYFATLCIFLLAAVLVHSKAITIHQPFIATLVTTLILFNLPGFLFVSLLKSSHPFFERIGLSFSIGVCIQLIIGATGLYFKISLDLFNALAFLPTALLGCVLLINLTINLFRDYQFIPSNYISYLKENYLTLLAFGLPIIALILFLGSEKFLFPLYWQRAHDDRLQFMPYINQYLSTNGLDPYGTIYTRLDARFAAVSWLPVLALISEISSVDYFDMYVVHFSIIVWFHSLIVFLIFSKYLFKKYDAALLALLIQLIYWASTMSLDIQQRAQAGYIALYMNLEDRCFAYLILLPVALIFFLSYQEKQEKSTLVVFTLFTLGLTAINPLGIVFLGITISSLLLFEFIVYLPTRDFLLGNLWRQVKNTVIKYHKILIALILPFPYLLFQRTVFVEGGSLSFSPENTLEDIDLLIDKLSEGRHILYFDNITEYMVKPTLLMHPLIIISLAMLFIIVFYVKKSSSALFIFSSYIFPLLLLFNPWTAPILGKLLGQQQLWRFRWIFPVSLAIAWVIYQLAELIIAKKRLDNYYRPVIILFFTAVLFSSQVLTIKQSFDYLKSAQAFVWENSGFLNDSMREALRKLDELFPPSHGRSMVLVDNHVARFVHTFSAKARAVEYGEDLEIEGMSRVDTRNEVYNLLMKNWLDPEVIKFLNDHNVMYILQRSGYPLNGQLRLMPQVFEKIYNNEYFDLYFVDYEKIPKHTLNGNEFITNNRWQEALLEYDKAVNENSNDMAAYIGKGTALWKLGRLNEAITSFQKAGDLSDNPITIQLVSELIGIDANFIVDFFREGKGYNSPRSPNTAIDFISYLEYARIFSLDHNLEVQSSVFILDGRPTGILFQHPPSQVSFDIDIPVQAWLQFIPAIAPEVWQFGKGDGVQFNINLETTDKRNFGLYNAYLDPKNLVDQRKLVSESVSLSQWAGESVTITFTITCGPNDNCLYDWAGWGEPRHLATHCL